MAATAPDNETDPSRRASSGTPWPRAIGLGFESSSDHISTHASYAVVLVEKPGREAIVEAFRARRCFAATDNIGLIVKCADHLMGEEFPLAGQPTLEIRAVGTAPITRLDIVRNNRYVYSTAPNRETARHEMDRRRSAARAGQLLLRPHPAGRRQPGLEFADVDPSAREVTTRGGSSGR